MKTIGVIVGVAIAGAFITVFSLYEAWAIKLLWQWFIVYRFKLPDLDYPTAIGVALVCSTLTHQTIYKPAETKDEKQTTFAHIIRPALYVLIGWIVKGFLS